MKNYFENVIGYDDVKLELLKIIDIINNKVKYEKFGTKIPRNLMLFGVPGTGKTLMATDLINAINRKSYIIRKDNEKTAFINHIKNTFIDAKKNAPSIILIDDLDKFENGDSEHRNGESYVTIQSCIDDVKNDDVFVIATVNDKKLLPTSLVREGRFDKQIEVSLSIGEDAEKIIMYYLEDKKIDTSINRNKLVRLFSGKSCAFIETVLNNAGLSAGYNNRKLLNFDDIMYSYADAIKRKIIVSNNIDPDVALKVAYHEAGHALIMHMLQKDALIYCSLTVDEKELKGTTESHSKIDGVYYGEKTLRDNIIMTLGGRAATEIVFGEADLGAEQDMRYVKRQAFKLVENNDFYSIDYNHVAYPFADEPLTEITKNGISYELIKLYNETKKILSENRVILDDIAYSLAQKHYLFYDEIETIVKRHEVNGLSKSIEIPANDRRQKRAAV